MLNITAYRPRASNSDRRPKEPAQSGPQLKSGLRVRKPYDADGWPGAVRIYPGPDGRHDGLFYFVPLNMKEESEGSKFSPVIKWVGYLTAISSLCATIAGIVKITYDRLDARRKIDALISRSGAIRVPRLCVCLAELSS